MRETASAAWYVMRLAWKTGPLALVLTFGEVISTVLRFLQPAFLGLIVDGLVSRAIGPVSWGTALLVASLAFGGVLEALAVGYRVKLIQDVGYAFDLEVMQCLSRIGDLDRLEQPRLATAIAKVKDRADAMGFCFNGLVSVVIQSAAPITSVCVAMAIAPRLFLLILGGIPAVLVTSRVTKLRDEADEAAQPYASRAVAWARLVPDREARAERKVFRLWDWYRQNMSDATGRRDAAFFRSARLDCAGSMLAELLYLCSAAAALLWILADGRVSAGAVAAAVLVSLNLKGALGTLRSAFSGLGPSLRAAVAMREVRAAAASAIDDAARPCEGRVASAGCWLVGVSYQHQTARTPALRGVDLVIEPGQVIAVVGANGAGKSTLVELLLGLRQPSSGQAELSRVKRSLISQDFGRYEFTVAEAVALNDRSGLNPDDLDKVRISLGQASARCSWAEHRDGIASQLGSAWSGGVDLSAGQWQAVAAARCFYVDDAEVVVLDEPTAVLDPQAQEVMTAQYFAAAQRVASRGGIAVLVTHRMSMPRLADRILVLHEGEVVEVGTHEDLVTADGRYAQAYHAQMSGFQQMAP